MKKPVRYIVQFCCLAVVFVAVLLQSFTHWVEMKPLSGFTKEIAKEELTFKTYYNGSYQDYLTEAAKENTGFRELFIRVYNQISYSCFGKISNDNIIEGANHELFLKMYLEEVTGKRLYWFYSSVEEAKADAQKNVEATKTLIDSLHSHGTSFLFIFAPSKTAVYPELMPQEYQEAISDFSLQAYYLQLFKENGLPYIDFLSYFQSIKDNFPYPLYTRTGTHWAESTIPMVADSIYRKLEETTGYRLPSIDYLDDNITADYSVQDGELEGNLNLLFPLDKPALPRPVFALKDTLGADRPNLLVIGDSYFMQLRQSCFVDAFNHWDYWKYNRDIASSRQAYNGKEVKYLPEAAQVLKEADIVIAIFTAPCYYNYMYGFPTTAINLYQKGFADEETAIQLKMEEIKNNPQWYNAVVKQAEERGLTVEENLRKNAIYAIETATKQSNNER